MSEHLKSHENEDQQKQHENLVHYEKHKHEEKPRIEHKEDLQSIRDSIELNSERAHSIKNRSLEKSAEQHQHSNHYSSSTIKQNTYKKTIETTQNKLKPAAKTFSRFVHNPAVESTSNVLEKTVARPKSILFGALFSLLGSLAMYYFAKKYGFSYNFLIYILLYAVFYSCGLIFEILIRRANKVFSR